ncbi:hypothetical protein AAHB43_00270 [Staphylococcus pseudintermedius]
MDTKKIKILGIVSNVFLILGLILLVFVSAWIALVLLFNFVRFESRVIQYAFSR